MLSNINFTRPLIGVAAERAIPIITDLHVIDTAQSRHNQDWMRAAHVLSCSHERLPCSPVDWIRQLWTLYATPIVIVGQGPEGALIGLRRQRAVWHVPAVTPRPVRYTSGAGDSLPATFAHHYGLYGDPVNTLCHGVLAAGWKVGAGPEEDISDTGTALPYLLHSHGLPAASRSNICTSLRSARRPAQRSRSSSVRTTRSTCTDSKVRKRATAVVRCCRAPGLSPWARARSASAS